MAEVANYRRWYWLGRVGRISRLVSPGLGWCHRCLTTWRFVRGHDTMYRDGSGCFPLCERCWADLTPEERLPYYKQLWSEWMRQGSEADRTWEQIESAVLEGK